MGLPRRRVALGGRLAEPRVVHGGAGHGHDRVRNDCGPRLRHGDPAAPPRPHPLGGGPGSRHDLLRAPHLAGRPGQRFGPPGLPRDDLPGGLPEPAGDPLLERAPGGRGLAPRPGCCWTGAGRPQHPGARDRSGGDRGQPAGAGEPGGVALPRHGRGGPALRAPAGPRQPPRRCRGLQRGARERHAREPGRSGHPPADALGPPPRTRGQPPRGARRR